MGRRDFLRNALVGGTAALFAPKLSRGGQGADSRIEVLLDEPIGTISPLLYGHFTENLGSVIYDGLWVGEDSPVPNIGGIRKSVVENLRKIKPGIIRWPGGCFADSYDWRDGVGPRASRPKRPNFWGGVDPNQFGTNEIVRFCRLAGADPYLAANLRGGTARDSDQWVEYCNSPARSTTLAIQRDQGGERDPLNVRYWGVGNEAWGCGGNFTPEEYASEYRRFTAWVPGFDVKLAFVGSGPNEADVEWTRKFFSRLTERDRGLVNSMYGWALHHYSWNLGKGKTNDWNAAKGDALKFDVEDWYELLKQADLTESMIEEHWLAMGEVDRRHHVKLVVDEWGAWFKPGTEGNPRHTLGQASTLRDAALAGLTLDIFNRNADKVGIACVAQLINCLASLFTADGDKFMILPPFHVFEMYAAHQGGQSLRTVFSAPPAKYERVSQPSTFWGLAGSASLHDKQLVVTAVNPDVSEPRDAEIVVRGARIKSGRATVLTASDIHAHNSFEEPDSIRPAESELNGSTNGPIRYRFEPKSITRLMLDLA
ncbi:MAG TPA: alpha-L-arabinofuranosidase C-terminal domain-containing protein [Blastocatellia bacterium]|nr:alpha-L-arabinofuranosidase C-terminal domain-containing protein [Blastocatellia bacterium]